MTLPRKIVSYGMMACLVFMSTWIVASIVQNFAFYNYDLLNRPLSSDEHLAKNLLPLFVGFPATLGWAFSIWMQKSMRQGLRQGIFAIVAMLLAFGLLGFLQYWLGRMGGVYSGPSPLSNLMLPSFASGYFLGVGAFFYGDLQKMQNSLSAKGK